MFDIDNFLDDAFEAAENIDTNADRAAEEYLSVTRTSLSAFIASEQNKATRRAPRRQASARR